MKRVIGVNSKRPLLDFEGLKLEIMMFDGSRLKMGTKKEPAIMPGPVLLQEVFGCKLLDLSCRDASHARPV